MAKDNRMRSKAKRFSAFLAVVLLVSAFSVSAFADGGTTTLITTVPYTVTLQIGEHGSVTVDGTKYTGNASFQKDLNAVLTYTITPDSGYKISKVTYDGTDVTTSAKSGTYTAAALQGNVTLTVTFTKKSPQPTEPPGPITGDESEPVFWSTVLALSALSLAAVLFFLKRRKAETN